MHQKSSKIDAAVIGFELELAVTRSAHSIAGKSIVHSYTLSENVLLMPCALESLTVTQSSVITERRPVGSGEKPCKKPRCKNQTEATIQTQKSNQNNIFFV